MFLATLIGVGAATTHVASAAEWQTLSQSGFQPPQAFGFSPSPAPPAAISQKLYGPGSPGFATSSFGSSSLFDNRSTARYADRLNEKWLLGIETSSGFQSSSIGSPFLGQGFQGTGGGVDYSATSARLGYDLNGFTPYVSTSIATVKPALGLGATPFDTGILAQNPSFSARTTGSVGAGFNYQATGNLQFSAGVSVGNSPAGLLGR